jgi:hypothetical protein
MYTHVVVRVIKSDDLKIITEKAYLKGTSSKYTFIEYVDEYIRREQLVIGISGKSYMVWENGILS